MALSFDELRKFLIEELGVEGDEIQPNTPLFSGGLVDSFSLVILMTYIENSSEISISPSDVNLDNFDSIERIIEFTKRAKLPQQ